MLNLIFIVLSLITAYKVFEKYSMPGWYGIIPFFSQYKEFEVLWQPIMGIIYIAAGIIAGLNSKVMHSTLIGIVCGLAYFVIGIFYAIKKAKAFGGGIILTIVLIFVPFIGNLYIGFNKNVQFVGKPE